MVVVLAARVGWEAGKPVGHETVRPPVASCLSKKLSKDPAVHPERVELVMFPVRTSAAFPEAWKSTTVPAVEEGQVKVGVAENERVTTAAAFPLPEEMPTADWLVTKPLPLVVTWQTCVESPQDPGPEFTVARVEATDPDPGPAVTSPVNCVMPPPVLKELQVLAEVQPLKPEDVLNSI